MKLKVKNLRFLTGKPVCMIHEKTAKQMSLHVANRVLIESSKGRKIISVVDTASGFLRPSEIALSEEILEILSLKEKDIVNVTITDRPDSIEYIKKKLKGETLSKQEITKIVYDIANNALTEVEVAFFISAVYANEMNPE